MAAPPVKKVKVNSNGSSEEPNAPQEEECTTISMTVGKGDCLSPITRIKGYPWRLRLCKKDDGMCELYIRCEKSMEAELWECTALVDLWDERAFRSMNKKYQEHKIRVFPMVPAGTRLEVEIDPYGNGDKWRCRPTLDLFDRRDGCILIEDKEIHVNKQFLASQSPYFDRLFNAEFKEKNMAEISVADVGYEEFANLLRMVYGKNDASVIADLLTRDNVDRVLELAEKFDLKIVEDGVVNFLLSSDSPFSIHEKLLIADRHKLMMCKHRIINQYEDSELSDLSSTLEYDLLSMDTKNALFKKSCKALIRANDIIKNDRR